MCPDPVHPGREVRGCSVGCILGVSDVSPAVFIVAANEVHGISKIFFFFFKPGCFGWDEFSCFFGTSVCAALFLNEQEEVGVSQAHRSQLATAALCTEQTPDEGSLL